MKKKELEKISNEVWDRGVYLSTRVREQMVVNSYAYEDFIIDIAFCAEKGVVVAVDVDDTVDLNPYRLGNPVSFTIHPN